jgi:hypothetical protein
VITPDQMHRIDPQAAQEPPDCECQLDVPGTFLLAVIAVTLLASFVVGVSGLIELSKLQPPPAPKQPITINCPKVTT